jgi:hypothetical protein
MNIDTRIVFEIALIIAQRYSEIFNYSILTLSIAIPC